MVDVKLGKVAFFCNGVLARTASGLRTDVDVLPFVSLGSADVVAEFTTVSSGVCLVVSDVFARSLLSQQLREISLLSEDYGVDASILDMSIM
mmetsp:Transcript_19180/g.63349  ORF Transcript_19180/g.63349 Transcript_19180/m.63349 type:complete len:92 (-) Transcript_19180:48-323(-)